MSSSPVNVGGADLQMAGITHSRYTGRHMLILTAEGTTCDLGIVESVYHLIMQCSAVDDFRHNIYNEIDKLQLNFEECSRLNPSQVPFWLLGRAIDYLFRY